MLFPEDPVFEPVVTEIQRFLGLERPERPAAAAFPRADSRERDILDLIARGLDNTQIAEQLFISPKTWPSSPSTVAPRYASSRPRSSNSSP